MGRLSDHIHKNYDNYYVNSGKKLFCALEHKMKKIFVVTLDFLEEEVNNGNIDEKTFKVLRSKILNIGNDQVRNMKKDLTERYNIEFITYHTVIPVIPLREGSRELGPLFPGSPRLRKADDEG